MKIWIVVAGLLGLAACGREKVVQAQEEQRQPEFGSWTDAPVVPADGGLINDATPTIDAL